jgi:hypothetical protein
MRHSFGPIVSLLLAFSAPARAADIRECAACSVVADAIASAMRASKREYWSVSVQFHDLLAPEQDAGLLLHQREIEPAWQQLDGFDSDWTIGLHWEISLR